MPTKPCFVGSLLYQEAEILPIGNISAVLNVVFAQPFQPFQPGPAGHPRNHRQWVGVQHDGRQNNPVTRRKSGRKKSQQNQSPASFFQVSQPRVGPITYLTCLPIRPAISNMVTCGLPKTALSLASALMLRLLVASCKPWALM